MTVTSSSINNHNAKLRINHMLENTCKAHLGFLLSHINFFDDFTPQKTPISSKKIGVF